MNAEQPASPLRTIILLCSRIGLFLFFVFIGLVYNLADGRH